MVLADAYGRGPLGASDEDVLPGDLVSDVYERLPPEDQFSLKIVGGSASASGAAISVIPATGSAEEEPTSDYTPVIQAVNPAVFAVVSAEDPPSGQPTLLRTLLSNPELCGETIHATEEQIDAIDRFERAIHQPRFIDATLTRYLRDALTSQRLLEDIIGARGLIGTNLEHVAMIETFATNSPRTVRRELFRLAGEWAQFLGWMFKDTGDQLSAEKWYDRAIEWAHRSGSADMVASALSMKSHLAWSTRDTGRAIDLAEASLNIHGTSAAVRALSAQQLARGYALSGEAENTDQWLGMAEELTHSAAENPDSQPPWVYFHSPARLRMQRAIAYTELGKGVEAVGLLKDGLREMSESLKRDRGWHVARLAVAHTIAGEVDEAAKAVTSAAEYVIETGSSQTLADIRRARANLHKHWSQHSSVREMEERLNAIAGR